MCPVQQTGQAGQRLQRKHPLSGPRLGPDRAGDMFDDVRNRLTDEDVIEVVAKYPNLLTIDLWGCEKLTDAAIVEIARHCPQLQTLIVT